MLVLTVGSFSVFCEISEITVKYLSDLGFQWFSSFLFSLYILLIYQGLSADAPPPGPTAAAAVALTVRAAPSPLAPRRRRSVVALTVRARLQASRWAASGPSAWGLGK